MRAGDLFGQTLREDPADAELASHRLLVRGGFVRRVAAGVFAFLPLGLRVLRRVEGVVRSEIDACGGTELLMPILQPAELWQRSGRWDTVDVLYRTKDRSGRDFCLAATHEEVVTFLASTELPSYRDLPCLPYQVHWKFRDEPRPRGGLLRGREFLMMDAYSFDADETSMGEAYARVIDAYRSTFARLRVTALMAEAQAGDMGGATNHEFIQPSAAGEDTFVACAGCGYTASSEAAVSRPPASYDFGEAPPSPGLVHTPGQVTVEEVSRFLGVQPRQLVKTLLFESGGDLVAAVIPGDRELNTHKFARVLDGAPAAMLSASGFAERGIAKGFSGPVGLDGVRMIADATLRDGRNLVTGANEADGHLTGVVPGRDFDAEWADLIVAEDGDRCARCDGTVEVRRGIEIGHVFQLGTRYSSALDATFGDGSGARRPFHMGCYGIGISRLVACIVEEHHDERGIAWPRAVAPFEVAILAVSKDPGARDAAAALHDSLSARGVPVLLDDRDGVSAGARFADADLIGYPLQVVVGKTFTSSGRVEVRVRATGAGQEMEPSAAAIEEVLATCP